MEEETSGSGFEDFGFIDLSFCDDLAEIEQDHSMSIDSDFESATTDTSPQDLAEDQERSIASTRIANIREYRAWVGSRSLHIS